MYEDRFCNPEDDDECVVCDSETKECCVDFGEDYDGEEMCFDCTNADFSDFDPDYCVEPTDEDDERFWFKKDEAED
jgi:hypothetical protein